jgi:hypothetical protein
MPFLLLPMIQRAWPVRQRAGFRWNHFFRAGAGCGHDRDRHDVRDDGVAAFLLRMQNCLIPVAVLLTFFKSMTPQRVNAIKNLNRESVPYFFTNSASEAVKPCK